MATTGHYYLCFAELAAVGRISDELTFAADTVPSFGDDSDRLPVLRRRLVGTLATLAFLRDARRLSWASLSCRTNTPCWLRQRKYRTPFTDPSFLPTNNMSHAHSGTNKFTSRQCGNWELCCYCCENAAALLLSSRSWKSATTAGLSHCELCQMALPVELCSTECGATPHSEQTSDMPLVMWAL